MEDAIALVASLIKTELSGCENDLDHQLHLRRTKKEKMVAVNKKGYSEIPYNKYLVFRRLVEEVRINHSTTI